MFHGQDYFPLWLFFNAAFLFIKCIWNAKGFYQETECKHPNALQGASTHFIQHVYCDCACLVGTHTVHVRALEFAQTDVSVPCSQMFVTRDN